jgi:hypothetical protein
MKRWGDDMRPGPRVPWYLTRWGVLLLLLSALGVGLCDPLWSAMPWAVGA